MGPETVKSVPQVPQTPPALRGPSTIITLHVNLAAAGFGSDAAGSELGEVVDCASGESLTVTVKKEGADTAIAVVKTKAALANFVVFYRKPPAAPVVAAVTAA